MCSSDVLTRIRNNISYMFMYVCALAGWLRRAKVRVNGARDDGTACMWTRNGIVISDDADGCRPPTRREKLSGYEVVIVHDLIGPTPSRWMYRSCVRPLYVTVGEVGLRKHHPRSATPATFGLCTASVSWGSLRCTGANETLMQLMLCEFCCAGMIPVAALTFGAEGTDGRAPATKVREDQERGASTGDIASGACGARGRSVRRGATPPVQYRCLVAEGAAIQDTWLQPTCKVSSGQGRDKSGRV
jgi:hypothetical protein